MKPDSLMVLKTIEHVKEQIPTTDCLPATFFVGNETDLNIVVAAFDDDADKEKSAAVVKDLALKMKAEFILFVSEAYMLKGDEATKDYLANRHKYQNLSDHPGAAEMVLFQIETATSVRVGTALIQEGRTLGPVEWSPATDFKGRFSSLLGPKPTLQ